MGYRLVLASFISISPRLLFERATVYIATGCYRELGAQILRLTVPRSGALCEKMAPESGVAKAAAAALVAKAEAAAAVRPECILRPQLVPTACTPCCPEPQPRPV